MSGHLVRNLAILSLGVFLHCPLQAGERQGKKPPPGSIGDTAGKIINPRKETLEASDRLRFVKEQGYSKTLREAEISGAIIEERRITERFLILSELRKDKLDPKELKVLNALNSLIAVDFDPATSRFKEAIEYLSEKLKVPIVLDDNSLKEANVEYDDPVKFQVKKVKVTARTVLRVILGNKGLSYIVKEGTIVVVTAKQARETMTLRTYNIRDLVAPDPRFGAFGQSMMLMNAQSLINTIMNASGDPALWQPGSAGASIDFLPGTMSLSIRAPAEIHYMMPQTFKR